jgi:hypothetical protein
MAAGWNGPVDLRPCKPCGARPDLCTHARRLIEACGAALVSLSREENGRWTAYGSAGLTVVGSDPVEVAARLWLQMRR